MIGPIRATLVLWGVWALSWGLAAVWSRRTVARPGGRWADVHYVPTLLGAFLLFSPARDFASAVAWNGRVWRPGPTACWMLCLATAICFLFAWWARLWLGSLWSGTVTRKAGHIVVDSGPYRLVRHPIYTGLIAAGFILAGELGTPRALAGAAVLAFGWWLKARLEERFLSAELGESYDDYRRRTPMLVPFPRLSSFR